MAEHFVLSDFLGRKMTINKEKRPYSIGFNGHAWCCPCQPCHRARQREGKKRGLPKNDDPFKVVGVVAYWRRAPRRKVVRKLRLVG